MGTVDKIFSLLKQNGFSQNELADHLNIKKSVLSGWKTGKSRSYKKYIEKIADFLEVSTDYLLSEENQKAAIKKFGFCWDYKEREKIKADARNKRDENNLTESEIIDTFVDEFKALFSRSLESCGYSLNHVDFNTYVSMLLNQEQWFKKCTSFGVYDKMVDKFGRMEGISQGSYYEIPQKSKKKLTSLEIDHIKKYRSLDDYGKKVIESILNIEYDRCQAAPAEEEPEIISIKFAYLPASAGTGTDLSEENYKLLDVKANELTAEADFAVRVSGDSMEPTYYDGDILLVKNMPYLNIGDIGIFILNGDGYVKEFGGDCLISHNNKYPDIKLSEHDVVICSGRVIGVLDDADLDV